MHMEDARHSVEGHYGSGEILKSVLRALREMGKDIDKLVPADLASVDEFHIRGRKATVELANRASLEPGLRVLDVGSGLGGSVRYPPGLSRSLSGRRGRFVLPGALGRRQRDPLGLHLLMGRTARTKFENNIRNLTERRFVVIQAVAQRT